MKTLWNIELRITKKCRRDTNWQHLLENTFALPTKQYLVLHVSQLRQRTASKTHYVMLQQPCQPRYISQHNNIWQYKLPNKWRWNHGNHLLAKNETQQEAHSLSILFAANLIKMLGSVQTLFMWCLFLVFILHFFMRSHKFTKYGSLRIIEDTNQRYLFLHFKY